MIDNSANYIHPEEDVVDFEYDEHQVGGANYQNAHRHSNEESKEGGPCRQPQAQEGRQNGRYDSKRKADYGTRSKDDDKRRNVGKPHPEDARAPRSPPRRDGRTPRSPPRAPSRSPRRDYRSRRRDSISPPRRNFARSDSGSRINSFQEPREHSRYGRVVTLPENDPPRVKRPPPRDESPIRRYNEHRDDNRSLSHGDRQIRQRVIRPISSSNKATDSPTEPPLRHSTISLIKPMETSEFDLSLGASQLVRTLLGDGLRRFFVARCDYYDTFAKTKRNRLWKAPAFVVNRILRAVESSDNVILLFSVLGTKYFQGLATVDKTRRINHPESERLWSVPISWIYIVDVPFYSMPHIPGLLDRDWNVKESFEVPFDLSERLVYLFEKLARIMKSDKQLDNDVEDIGGESTPAITQQEAVVNTECPMEGRE